MDGSNRSRKQYKNNKKKDSKKGILICALQKNLLINKIFYFFKRNRK